MTPTCEAQWVCSSRQRLKFLCPLPSHVPTDSHAWQFSSFSPFQAFGVFSVVLFSVDTIYYCMMNRRASSAPPLTFEGEPTDDVPQKEPLPY